MMLSLNQSLVNDSDAWSLRNLWRVYVEEVDTVVFTLFTGWALHHILLIAFAIFWFLVELIPSVERLKIQPGIYPKFADYVEAFRQLTVNSLILWSPSLVALTAAKMGVLPDLLFYVFPEPEPGHVNYDTIPHWSKLIGTCWVMMVIEDTWSYFIHRYNHINKTVYKYVHKRHHSFTVPMALSADYVHPLESIFLTPGVLLAIFLCCSHVSQILVFNVVRTWHLVVMHCGYDIWWLNPLNILPGYIGPVEHDLHHEYPTLCGNFAPTFIFWDLYLGTYTDPRDLREKLAKIKSGSLKKPTVARVDENKLILENKVK